jgi:hypothetical protein
MKKKQERQKYIQQWGFAGGHPPTQLLTHRRVASYVQLVVRWVSAGWDNRHFWIQGEDRVIAMVQAFAWILLFVLVSGALFWAASEVCLLIVHVKNKNRKLHRRGFVLRGVNDGRYCGSSIVKNLSWLKTDAVTGIWWIWAAANPVILPNSPGLCPKPVPGFQLLVNAVSSVLWCLCLYWGF